MRRIRWMRYVTLGLVGLGSVGCANFWDDVTSQQFRFKDLYTRQEPMAVLRESSDGDARAKALRALEEPGPQRTAEQDEAMRFLTESAVHDPRPLCRLAAIETLSRFQDPRATAPLVQAYQTAQTAPFLPEIRTTIQSKAVLALGKKKSPDATALLLQAVAVPKAEANPTKLVSTGPTPPVEQPDAYVVRDLRLAAIRALGQTKDPQAIPALLPILSEKDVALRDRAQEALQEITGRKDVIADAQAWQAAIAGRNPSPTPPTGTK